MESINVTCHIMTAFRSCIFFFFFMYCFQFIYQLFVTYCFLFYLKENVKQINPKPGNIQRLNISKIVIKVKMDLMVDFKKVQKNTILLRLKKQ